MSAPAVIEGHVDPGYEAVADEFETNFRERGDIGAAFAAVVEGSLVVDIWGGVADRETGRPWDHDTLQIIFSGTKGLTAICIALLVERGVLDLDARVSDYWPEFAAAGKERVTVAEVLGHRARLPGLFQPVTWQEATDAGRMAALIAAQPQNNDPRAASTYHALTFGWICGELVRRIDGRSIGSFLREEIADPLALEIWIGLPADLEPRVSRVEMSPHWGASPASISANLERDELLRSVFANPRRYEPEHFPWNETSWHVAEVPAANAIATARAVATLYGSLDELLGSATLNLVQERQSATHDSLSGIEIAFGAGFQLQTSRQLFGPVARALGHSGSGGSRHGFWPDERVGFSYAMNLMRDDPEDDRAVALLAALHDGVRGTRR